MNDSESCVWNSDDMIRGASATKVNRDARTNVPATEVNKDTRTNVSATEVNRDT